MAFFRSLTTIFQGNLHQKAPCNGFPQMEKLLVWLNSVSLLSRRFSSLFHPRRASHRLPSPSRRRRCPAWRESSWRTERSSWCSRFPWTTAARPDSASASRGTSPGRPGKIWESSSSPSSTEELLTRSHDGTAAWWMRRFCRQMTSKTASEKPFDPKKERFF